MIRMNLKCRQNAKAVFESIKKKNAKVIFIYIEPFDLGSIKGSK
jgi:hypothetical protein